MSEQQGFKPKSILDSYSNALHAERSEVMSRNPMLVVNINISEKNINYSAVTMKVIHFIRGEERTKSFDAKTQPAIIYAALERLKEYARIPYSSDEKPITSWDIQGPKFVDGKPTQERITGAKLVVGRNKKSPFISVVHWNSKYPQIPFYPGLNDERNVKPTSPDNEEATYNFVCATAQGWATHIANGLAKEWQEGLDRVIKGGGGSAPARSNYGSSNNNGYGANESSASADDFNFG